MHGRERERGRGRRAAIAAALLALAPAATRAGADASNVRLVHNSQRFAVARALDGAARTFGDPECQALLDEFKDASGRPLRAALEESGRSAPEYLRWVFFYDAPPRLCGTSALAVTRPQSRAIFVCGSRFVRQAQSNSRHAEAVLIHEALHSLGLGENPPSTDEITRRIRARCGRR
jgi:hypothetical protein